MKVYKFGGSSIKDVKNIKNISNILKLNNNQTIFIVISAMGKTTNALEEIVNLYLNNNTQIYSKIDEILKYHMQIAYQLFDNNHIVFDRISNLFEELILFLNNNKDKTYNFIYDQIVSFGEFFSTTIISHYLNTINIFNIWLDVRKYIQTDNCYREANVDWKSTEQLIKTIDQSKNYITQGFLGSYLNKYTTTLGREGSDYTASIFSYCLDADEQIIWKDVPGILNADPRYFPNTKLIPNISYQETIELAYYGASVIHPKTIYPLQQKNIPLYVRSFINSELIGTLVTNQQHLDIPCYILKKHQILLIINTKKSFFIIEKDFFELLKIIDQYKIKINIIQNSATQLSLCLDDKFHQIDNIINKLSNQYIIKIYYNVFLYTIRNYTNVILAKNLLHQNILLKQITLNTLQWIVKEENINTTSADPNYLQE